MALDKQRILSELNSVVNQLQSSDCGCMGKLFSSSGSNNNSNMHNPMSSYGGCKNCSFQSCGHSHGAPYGEPCRSTNMHSMNRSCMGQCNPPQLYSDTYHYLNGNLMQPIVQEVYNDLKSITPDNTICNNPMASNMGLSNTSDNKKHSMPMLPSATGIGNHNPTSKNRMGSVISPNVNNNSYSNQQMGSIAGMGPQIMNMMMGDGNSKPSHNTKENNGQPTGSMFIDPPQHMQGKVDFTPPNIGNVNQSQFNTPMDMNMRQGNTNAQIPNSQKHNMYGRNDGIYSAQMHPVSGFTGPGNPFGSRQMDNAYANPAAQQMAVAHSHPQGQHTQGVAKFNEIFPGVMQGLGGDLNFDPMDIAIQMNPSNQQKAAIDTMHNIMNGKSFNKTVDPNLHTGVLQPVIAGANASVASITQNKPDQIPNLSLLDQTVMPVQLHVSEQGRTSAAPSHPIYNVPQQQQVYTALTNHNTRNQQHSSIDNPMQYSQAQRQIIDPNSRDVISPPNLPTLYERNLESRTLVSDPTLLQPQEQLIEEPMYPVETSNKLPTSYNMKQQQYREYNTLGQPVEMLSANMYHVPEPTLPQTLAPQHILAKTKKDHMRYSNVKHTVSKTSLMRNDGRTASRSQLHRNHYKGSQSYTQQNIKGSGHGATQSEGHLKVYPGKVVNQSPFDRVGDSIAQNVTAKYDISNKAEELIDYNDNVSSKKPIDDTPQKTISAKQSKCRNGLQDLTYTSYPMSTAWSFHGYNH